MVSGFNGLGLATLTSIANLFPNQFRNVVFISVGEVDSALFKGPEELQQLEAGITDDLQEYCRLAADLGFHAELRAAIGTDVVLELRAAMLRGRARVPAFRVLCGTTGFRR